MMLRKIAKFVVLTLFCLSFLSCKNDDETVDEPKEFVFINNSGVDVQGMFDGQPLVIMNGNSI